MTFETLTSAVLADMNLNTVASPPTLARIRRYLNEGVRAVFREPGLERLADSDAPYTFTSVPGQARYAAAEAVARIQRISERTNDRTLEALPMDRYRRAEPDPVSSSGTPTHYVPIGRVVVSTQPTTLSVVVVKSTDALEDPGPTAYVEGLGAGGYKFTAQATVHGLIPQALHYNAAAVQFTNIDDFYLSSPPQGMVQLLAGPNSETATFELARITPGQTRSHYTAFYLFPTPAAEVTYYVDYRRRLLDMVNETDEPPLPVDFHPMVATYARMREYEKADDDRYAIARSEYERALGRLKFATQWSSDELPVMGRGGRVGYSRLGSQYPADSWR